MIVGKGMLAKSLYKINDEKFIYFCSGVSNSKEINELEYEREKKLLIEHCSEDKCIIYFSSYFVGFDNYLKQRYYRHKLDMENVIKKNFKYYKIFRLPQVVGNSENINTLTNFLYNSILNNIQINVYENVKRNLIDVEDIVTIIKYINENNLFLNKVINLIATQNFEIIKIVNSLEEVLDKKSIKKISKNDEKDFSINISEEIKSLYDSLDIRFDDKYLTNLINKYYGRSNG